MLFLAINANIFMAPAGLQNGGSGTGIMTFVRLVVVEGLFPRDQFDSQSFY